MSPEDPLASLHAHYQRANAEKFGGALPGAYRIELNPHLRRLTGRITYGARLIEVSSYHLRRYGLGDAIATLEHEMLHLYLHVQARPSGHNVEFKRLAIERGIRVYHANPYPRNTPPRHRYLYECQRCGRMVSRRRPVGPARLACGACCREHARGAWDPRFELRLLHLVRFG